MVRPQPTGHVPLKQEESPSTKAKTKVVFVEQKKKTLDIVSSQTHSSPAATNMKQRYDSSIPKDYQLVEYGNKEVIDFLLERSRKNGLPVWVANSALSAQKNAGFATDPTKLSSHVGRVGYHFHKDLVAKAQKQFKVTLQKGKIKSLGHGKIQKVTKADHERGLTELYPRIPDRDRQTVIRSLSVFHSLRCCQQHI